MNPELSKLKRNLKKWTEARDGALSDRGLWDKTLSPEDLERNKRYLANIEREVHSMQSRILQIEMAEAEKKKVKSTA